MEAAPWPKRRVTILTSSGWETSLGMGYCPLRTGFAAIGDQEAGHMLGRQLVEKIVVDLDGWTPAAGADAFHFFERKDAVSGDAFVAYAEFFLKALVEVV